jgi:hypothetical protein
MIGSVCQVPKVVRHSVSSENLSLASVTGTSTTPELPLDEEEAEENMQGNYSSLFLLYSYEGNIMELPKKVLNCINIQIKQRVSVNTVLSSSLLALLEYI